MEERNAEDVIQHLHQLSTLGVTSVCFSDDDFPVASQNAQKFARLMVGTGLSRKLRFSLSTRATNIVRAGDDQEERQHKLHCFRSLVEAGLKEVFIGLESFSEPQLKRYGIFSNAAGLRTSEKKQASANLEVVKLLEEAGVSLVAGFISIDPMMTDVSELECNLVRLRDSEMYKHVTNPLHVLRVQVGTPYEKLAMRAGLISKDKLVDLVFYESSYKSEVVETIAVLSGNWNARKGATDYALKALHYSSYANDSRFEISKHLMERLRLLDVEFGLKLCRVGKFVGAIRPDPKGRDIVAVSDAEKHSFAINLAQTVVEFERRRIALLYEMLTFDLVARHDELAACVRKDINSIESAVRTLVLEPGAALAARSFLGKRTKAETLIAGG